MLSKRRASGDLGNSPALLPSRNLRNSNNNNNNDLTRLQVPAATANAASTNATSTADSDVARRMARRNKREEARQIKGRPTTTTTTSVPTTARTTRPTTTTTERRDPAFDSTWNSSSREMELNMSDENDDDEMDVEEAATAPGAFAVSGSLSSSRQQHPSSQVNRRGVRDSILSEPDNIGENTIIPDNDDNFKKARHSTTNADDDNDRLPVAYSAELVMDAEVIVATSSSPGVDDEKDCNSPAAADRGRTYPLKCLWIGICLFFVLAIAAGVSVGLVLGGTRERSPANRQATTVPTLPPQPTFAPVIVATPMVVYPVTPSTVPSMVPSDIPSVAPSMLPSVVGATSPPTIAPTEKQPTDVSVTDSPTMASLTPTISPVIATLAPTTVQEEEPTDPPVFSPTDSPTMTLGTPSPTIQPVVTPTL